MALGDVSFESKGLELNFDQVLIKVCLHELHLPVKNALKRYFEQAKVPHTGVSKILQDANTLAIDILMLQTRKRLPAVLVVASGVLLVVGKTAREPLVSPFPFSRVLTLVMAHNQSGLLAIQVDQTAAAAVGASHLVVESQHVGLLLRFAMSSFCNVRLDFADAIRMGEPGRLEEVFFQQFVGNVSLDSDLQNNLYTSKESSAHEGDHRISQALLALNQRGVLSARSDVVAILSGELLQLRVERPFLFGAAQHFWDSRYFLLTSAGLLRVDDVRTFGSPLFVPLAAMESTELARDDPVEFSTE